jgi:RNA polymerase sigma factor (sigma-70 family)
MLDIPNILPIRRDLLYEMIGIEHPSRSTSVFSDAEFARAVQGGDATSLGILLERHRAPLYAVALRMLGHGAHAEDAIQDTSLIALRSIDRLREPEAVGGWLHGILRNVCLRQLRERRDEVHFDEVAPLENRSSEPSAEETIEQLAMREWVWSALYELPEALRVTAMLRYFGYFSSYEEISAILGVPVGTVCSRLSQVKVKLAEALLKTAGLEHDEARKVAESQRSFTAAWTGEYNRGEGYELLASAFSQDSAWAYTSGKVVRGVPSFEGDLEAGMKLHPTYVLASKDVTVMEADFENPSDDPYHCPPATSLVFFYREGRIQRACQYYAPRPEKMGRHDFDLVGEHDPYPPREEQERLAREIPAATLKVYPESSHAMHWERPEQVVRDLEEFMKDTRPAQ